MLLHEEHVRPRRVHGDAVHAMAHLGLRIGKLVGGHQALVDRPPRLARRRPCGTRRPRKWRPTMRSGSLRLEQDRVQAHPARAWLPEVPLGVPQAGKFLPILPAIRRAEQRGVLRPGIHRVRVGQRRLEMPDALELPGMLRAVIPLVRARRRHHTQTCPPPAPRFCRRRWTAGSSARTSRWFARHKSGSGPQASL